MKSLQSGIAAALVGVAIAFAALFGSVLLVMAQSTAPVQEPQPATPIQASEETSGETSAIQAVGVLVTATVGTVQGQCATTTSIQILANTTVYYCLTVQHSGVAGDEALTTHRLESFLERLNRQVPSITLQPSENAATPNPTRVITQIGNELITGSTAVDTTNIFTWTSYYTPRDGGREVEVFYTTTVTIDVVNPASRVTKTVGQDRTTCPTSQSQRIPSGQNVAFCISVQNTGDVDLTSHTLEDQPLGINATFNYTLTPGQILNIIPTNMTTLGISGSLERLNVNGAFTNTATLTSRTSNGLTASGVSTATVDIGTTTVRFTKTVSTEPETCLGSSTIQVQPGTRVYYCVLIENTGVVTLTEHHLIEQYLSIDVQFDYPLRPGEVLKITNDFLARNNLPIVFGPFELHPRFGNVINNTMTYQGTAPDGFSVTTTAGTSSTFPPVPTATSTSRPDPPATPTPGPTWTPTPTFTPTPITPSPTPTDTPVTPSPTPTRSYAISLLETPTPRMQAAGVPGMPQQEPTPPFDPNQPQLPPDQQFPDQDPVLATATQMAVDATTTAVVAAATASQLAIDEAAATARAQVEAQLPPVPEPTSPLPTPFVESPLATPTDMFAPTPGAVGEAVTVEGMPPGAEVTVLPPLVTVIIATETPAVVVLIVTNTPAPGETLPEGQRPIVYPTPTPTPDFVMAAARTLDVAVTTMGWLWFLVGSLIFFVTAGVVAGLFFRQSEVHRYELPEPDYWLEEEPVDNGAASTARARQDADEEWPADLP